MQVARVTDMGVGTCCCHKKCKGMTGFIITGSEDDTTNSLQTARVGDIVLGACGHVGILVSGSEDVITDNQQEIRVTDPFVGCFSGTIISGSPDTKDNG